MVTDIQSEREAIHAAQADVRKVRSAYYRASTLALTRPDRADAFRESAARLKEFADNLEYVETVLLPSDAALAVA